MFNDLFDDVLKDILDIEDDKRTDDITQYVAFVLDQSGSMLDIRQAAIDAFNEQLQTLRKESGADIKTMVTVTKFNDGVELGESKLLASIDDLSEKTYMPNGLTALFDAMGDTILQVAKQYKDDDSDAAVLFVIVTDGHENASCNYRQDRIKSMVKELEKTGRWTFTFLAANQDPLETAVAELGMKSGNVMNFMATDAGMKMSGSAMSCSTSSYMASRKMGETTTDTFYDKEEEDEGEKVGKTKDWS
jgi:uncharacterized protein YegL